MKSYRWLFLISAIVISIPCVFLTIVGIANSSMYAVLFWGGILSMWWFASFYLLRSGKGSFTLSFVLANGVWWPLLFQTIRRVLFVVENGRMERADGYGSPLAFLIGAAFEQFFFLPLSFVVIQGFVTLFQTLRERRKPQQAEGPDR